MVAIWYTTISPSFAWTKLFDAHFETKYYVNQIRRTSHMHSYIHHYAKTSSELSWTDGKNALPGWYNYCNPNVVFPSPDPSLDPFQPFILQAPDCMRGNSGQYPWNRRTIRAIHPMYTAVMCNSICIDRLVDKYWQFIPLFVERAVVNVMTSLNWCSIESMLEQNMLQGTSFND